MTDNVISGLAQDPGTTSSPGSGTLKSGALRTPHIVAMVIAAAAPLASAVAVIPLGTLLGNGIGMPGTIVLMALMIALFGLGFVKVVPHIKNAGAFYAYVTAGLGRPAGLTSAYALILVYVALGASVSTGVGYFLHLALLHYLSINISWIICGTAAALLSTVLTILGIDLAARVLFVVLIAELIVVLVVDFAILFHNGAHAFPLASFKPKDVFATGSFGVAAIYTFTLFLGFEGAAIYSEEAVNPNVTVPRATFWTVGLIGVFYAFSSWAMVAGAGANNISAAIGANPGNFTFSLSSQYVGGGWTNLMTIMNLFSLFAGTMAFQNASARYLFALGRDKMLPSAFARTHGKRGTPTIALVTVGGVFIAISVPYWVANLNPLLQEGTSLIGLGSVALMALVAVASLSIAVYFLRRREFTFLKVVAPILAAIALGACTAAGIANYSALTGATGGWINELPWLYVPIIVAGLGFGFYLKAKRPAKYATIGITHL